MLQEFHLTQAYHDGLLKLQAKDYEKARELLESVLKDPLISNAEVSVCSMKYISAANALTYRYILYP